MYAALTSDSTTGITVPLWWAELDLMREYGWTYDELQDTPELVLIRAAKKMELERKAERQRAQSQR